MLIASRPRTISRIAAKKNLHYSPNNTTALRAWIGELLCRQSEHSDHSVIFRRSTSHLWSKTSISTSPWATKLIEWLCIQRFPPSSICRTIDKQLTSLWFTKCKRNYSKRILECTKCDVITYWSSHSCSQQRAARHSSPPLRRARRCCWDPLPKPKEPWNGTIEWQYRGTWVGSGHWRWWGSGCARWRSYGPRSWVDLELESDRRWHMEANSRLVSDCWTYHFAITVRWKFSNRTLKSSSLDKCTPLASERTASWSTTTTK